MGRILLTGFMATCCAAYSIWSVVDHSPAWKIIVPGLAAITGAFDTFRSWNQDRA